MKNLTRRSFCLLLLILSVLALSAHARAAIELTILHMNDLHGHIVPYLDKSISDKTPVSGAAYYGGMIEEERKNNPEGTLLLSAGDMFQGTPISNLFHGKPVIEVMNHLRFDAMALGNHEFDWGRDVLNSLRSSAAFPFVSANIADARGLPIPGIKPYVIVTRKDLRIAIIGMTTTETSYTTNPGNVSNLVFTPPEKILPATIREVRSQGANFIIVLSHLGVDADIELTAEVSGIDVIVGGHSHTAVLNPMKVGETIIVQAGYYGLYLGVLELQVDTETHKITGFTRENALKTVFAGPEAGRDDKIGRIVSFYNDQVKDEFAKIVGEAQVDLLARPYEESNLGNLLCDAMREASGAHIAFQNGGGIRADIPTGKITQNSVYTVLPFDNLLVTMSLTGKQVLQLLEKSATLGHKILQVSGLRVNYDLKKPDGAKVFSVHVKSTPSRRSKEKALEGSRKSAGSSGGYEPLKPAKVYRVATNDFLAAGGDQFVTFKEGKKIVYGENLRDLFANYLRKHSPVNPQVEGRITFQKSNNSP